MNIKEIAIWALTLMLALSIVSCSDDEDDGGGAVIQVFPGQYIDFGAVNIFQETPATIKVTIKNIGNETLRVNELILDDNSGAFDVDSAMDAPFELTMSDTTDILVSFGPEAEEEYDASLIIESNANNYPEYSITLYGVGTSE
jgi:hypothetical protein